MSYAEASHPSFVRHSSTGASAVKKFQSSTAMRGNTKQYSRAAFEAVRMMEDKARELSKKGTTQEILHLRKTFSRMDMGSNRNGILDEDHVELFFAALGVHINSDLLRALMSEDTKSHTEGWDLSDVMHIYFLWKEIASVRLPTTTPWHENTLVKGALQTEFYLIDSFPRSCWNLFMMLCALVHWTIIFYRDATEGIQREPTAAFVTLDWLLSVAYAVDLYLWLFTASCWSHFQQSLSKVRQHYYYSWFIPDLLSTLPLDVILSLSGAHFSSGIFSHLRLVRVWRACGAWGVSGYMPLTNYYIKFYFELLPLSKTFYLLVAFLQVISAIFVIIKKAVGNERDLFPLDGDPYITAVYFVMQTFTTVGYGDVRLTHVAELWFAVFVVFIGLVLNGFIIGKLVAIIQLGTAKNRRIEKLRETMAVLEYFDIPAQLQVEILNFQSHVLWSTVDAGFSDVTGALPSSMRENIQVAERIRVIQHVPLFASASQAVMVTLAKALAHRASKPEEYVVCVTDKHQGLHWLLFGFVDQLDARGRYIKTLKTGDFFGVEGILDLTPEQSNYKALSYCDLFRLSTKDFHDILKKYPVFGASVRHSIERQVDEEEMLSKTITTTEEEVSSQASPKIQEVRHLHLKLKAFKEKLVASIMSSDVK